MKGRVILLGVAFGLGFVGGLVYATLTKKIVPTIVEYRESGPTRVVSRDWHVDRFSPGHSQHVLNHALECNLCHDPAKEDFEGVDMGVCTSCHLQQASHPHLGEDGEITECTTCHTFKFYAEAVSSWDCVRCHGPFDMPTHTGLAMHADIACANCHDPHRPVDETAAECTDCHDAFEVRHGDPELSGTCADCHGGHKLASEAASCMKCHQEAPAKVPSTAVFGRIDSGHSACVQCHEPHSFSEATAVRCESCHKRTSVLAERTARDHRRCNSCHDPHAVRAAGDRTCMGCHQEVASSHPVEDQGNCVSCHEPHPKRAAQIALQCTQCHEEAGTENGYHAARTVCTDCHAPHAFDLSTIAVQSLCVDCHSTQAKWTRRIPDHTSCQSCHEGTAHALGEPAACASCHGDIQAASPEGHRECASCHEPHGGTLIAGARTCTSCHDSGGLPGLHRIPDDPDGPGHSDCATCHNPHNMRVRADRASCMECHTDMGDHQPEAEVCTGCHTFISGKPSSALTPRATPRPRPP